MTDRYVVKSEPFDDTRPVVVHRVYDTATDSYPALNNGIRVQGHYSARDHAQQVVDKLNGVRP